MGNGQTSLADGTSPSPHHHNHNHVDVLRIDSTRDALDYLHYLYPIALLFLFLSLFTTWSVRGADNDNAKPNPETQHPRHLRQSSAYLRGKPLPRGSPKALRSKARAKNDLPQSQRLLFQWLSIFAAITFLGNAANEILHALVDRDEGYWCGKPYVIYVVGSFFLYFLFVISLLDVKHSPTYVHLSTWLVAEAFEVVLFSLSLSIYTEKHRIPKARPDLDWRFRSSPSRWEIAQVSLALLRILLLASLVAFYFLFVVIFERQRERVQYPEETASLFSGQHTPNGIPNGSANGNSNGTANGYGTMSHPPNGKTPHGHSDEDQPRWMRRKNIPAKSWWEYIRGYRVFFPYLWPSKDRRLQLIVIVCVLIVSVQRGLNVLVPYQVGRITDDLSGENGEVRMPWVPILWYILFHFLQGSSGLLGSLRSMLWIPVGQYSYRELSVASFEHVHSLSLDFHLGKRTGEVMSAMGKGSAINSFLEQITFQVVPMIADLCVAVGYFLVAFDPYYALIVTVITFWYIYLTMRMAQWRSHTRRVMVNSDREQDAVKNDSLVSYETVKYFNAEEYEFQRFRRAVSIYQTAEFQANISLLGMAITQDFVFMIGLMITCFIAAYQVTIDQLKVGQFVTLLTYMWQLQAPLKYFGSFYRTIQSSLINSERMLELFKEQPTVVDEPGVEDLLSCEGHIRFNDVKFSYDGRKPALRGLDFECRPGTTTAFVGESGGGKSTVFRLLCRFYNPEDGSIQIDGHDVEGLSIDSVRRHFGVVPQDTILFNESIMYNLQYANRCATKEEIFAACRAASIHDKIMSFPDGYDTKVGDRGLRLSGGEKQRIAIARTIIKGPRIILLDEATAALDTETEEHIQNALKTLGQGRTMLIIAHRLSTIMRADQILVLHEGKVLEKGSHDELIAKGGKYAKMWRRQIRAQKVAEEAVKLQDQAAKLKKENKDANLGRATGECGESSPCRNEEEGRGKQQQQQPAAAAGRGGEDARLAPPPMTRTISTVLTDSGSDIESDDDH